MLATLHWAARRFWYAVAAIRRIRRYRQTRDDPNDKRNRAAFEGMTTTIPLATVDGKRNGTREFIRVVQMKYPRRLTDPDEHPGHARPLRRRHARHRRGVPGRQAPLSRRPERRGQRRPYETKTYRCSREVILAGGAFNTPQLLMLSGIGPKEHSQEIGIPCLVDRPGVGSNLQDRYEVGVVSEMKKPFAMLKGATFKAPAPKAPPDPCFEEWLRGRGLYTSNGAMAALILKSDCREAGSRSVHLRPARRLPRLLPRLLEGRSTKRKDHLTWAILKAHTNNTGGTVRLRSSDPFDTPDIHFHYFEEGTDTKGEDLEPSSRP